MPHEVVAIDGPAGAGKSTVARRLARHLGYGYLPSGNFYRALAWRALDAGVSPDDEAALVSLAARTDIRVEAAEEGWRTLVDGRDVTDELDGSVVGDAASRLSVFSRVRARMVELQRRAGQRQPVVAEGRDMASVVFPDAEHKFYLDAAAGERARRRARDLRARGEAVDEAALAREMAGRDARDSSRAAAPLRQVEGAVRVDTTDLTIEEVVERLVGLMGRRPR
ncbi:MAG: (d)CMP kinase [Planctomycetota bacterium]